jgi:molybdate transport system permease protein
MPCWISWPAPPAGRFFPTAASRLNSSFLSPDEWEAVRLTLSVSAWAVVCGLPVALLTAFALVRGRFPGRPVLDALAHLPLVLPPVVVGWLLLLVFGRHGVIGAWLEQWFGIRLVFTRAGATLACAVMVFPLMLRAIRLSLEAIDPGLEQAACTLGAGRLDRFATIVLPLAAPGILVAAVVGFAASLGEFGAVITFAADIPGETQTLPLAIYAALQSPGGEATAARLSLVSVVLAVGGLLLADALGGRLRTRIGR